MTQRIFITGASRGIGRYLFDSFLGRGAAVHGTYFSTGSDDPALSRVDVGSFESVNQWITERVGDNDQLVLINCAGITNNAMLHSSNPDDWHDVVRTNLIGPYNAMRAILPFMRTRLFGRVINLSSVVGQRGAVGASAYAASKSALTGLTKTAATENASKGITVNNINLGYFDIGMIQQVPEKFLTQIIAQTPTGRLGAPTSIRATVDYLIECADITGAAVDVNGGLF